MPRKIGIIGYGKLGKFLVNHILQQFDLELSFVWCPNPKVLIGYIDSRFILKDLSQFRTRNSDLIVDLSLPEIAKNYGALFLQEADYMIAHPVCLINPEIEKSLKSSATDHGIYIPSGILWGAEDIKKMADEDTLQSLKIIIKKQPSHLSVTGDLKKKNDQVKKEATILFNGNVRSLYPLAPLHIGPMIVTALAAHTLGFDNVEAEIISDPNLKDEIVIKLEVLSQETKSKRILKSSSVTIRPRLPAEVKEAATHKSFLNSMLKAHGKGGGLHLC